MNSDVFIAFRWPISEWVTFLNRQFRVSRRPLPLCAQTIFPISGHFSYIFLQYCRYHNSSPTSNTSKLHSYRHIWVTRTRIEFSQRTAFLSERKTTCFTTNEAGKRAGEDGMNGRTFRRKDYHWAALKGGLSESRESARCMHKWKRFTDDCAKRKKQLLIRISNCCFCARL